MKILMTGGTGLIGQTFAWQFKEYQLTVLTRSCQKVRKLLPRSVRAIESLDSLASLSDFDAVVNLAGEPIIDKRWTDKQKKVICESRWQITRQLVDLLIKADNPPSVFLSGSAIGIYGNQGDSTITEFSQINGDDFASQLCDRWEGIANEANSVTRVVNLRTGIILSPHGGALSKMLPPFKWCLGGVIGDGRQYMAWIHYQDYLNALHYLLINECVEGAVNLVAPEPERNQVFVQTLAKVMRRFAFMPAPKVLLHCLLGESACLLLDSQKAVPRKLLDSGFVFSFPRLQAALADLLKNPSYSMR